MNHPTHHRPPDPTAEKRERLILQLQRSRDDALAALRGADDRTPVHEESDWRIQDLLGHLAAWEREALAALQAHAEGEPFQSEAQQLGRQGFNSAQYQRRRSFDPMQCRMDWAMVRRELQHALHELPPDRLADSLRLPWGGQGSVEALVAGVCEHEAEHVATIRRALAAVAP